MASVKLQVKESIFVSNCSLNMKLDQKQKHIFLKCTEELNELAVELIQSVNKANKNNWDKIFDEIEDVEKYIKLLKEIRNS
jgi:hypothetical protein